MRLYENISRKSIRKLTIRMMISNSVKYIKNLASNFIDYCISIPKYIRDTYNSWAFFVHDQKIKFQDILTTNIELGKHHLFQGRLSDALFRFRAVHFLFDSGNKEANYWIGWCYFFKSKYDIATPYLEDSKEHDKFNLLDFIKNSETTQIVPPKLWDIMQKIRIATQDNQYYVSSTTNFIDLPLEFVKFCTNRLDNIDSKTEILDYGCNTGIVGSTLDYILPSEYKISAVEHIDALVDYTNKITGDRGHVYDEVIDESLYNAHKALKAKKYDLITSFDSLIFTSDLSHHFKSFHKALNKNGYCAILLPLGAKTEWSKNNKSFVFDENDIENQLILAEFNILDIKKWKLNSNKSFLGIICNKI